MSVFCVRREDSPAGTVQSLEITSTSSMGERGGTLACPCFVSAEKTAPVGPYNPLRSLAHHPWGNK